jgi:D-serine deaminase-like pyridoxal phosphate-dependent protein
MTRLGDIHDLPTPALLLDWAAASRNIATASKLIAPVPAHG